MILKWINQILLVLTAGLVIFFGVHQRKMSRVAFVRSAVVLEKYSGMNEAKSIYQKKIDQWKMQFDSLEFNYNKSLQELNKISALPLGERKKLEENLKNQEQIVDAYSKSIEQKANEENEKLTQGVLNQVNEYIKKYAQQNDYDIVLGVTLSGNILYGDDAIDITQEVIDGMNAEYSGKNK